MALLKSNLLRTAIAIILGIVIVFFSFGFDYALDCLFYPWAHSLTGKPTLMSNWRGQIIFVGQTNREISLRLRREPYNSGSYPEGPTFDGTAQMPDELGNLIDYDVSGRSNRSGSEVVISLACKNRKSFPQKQAVLQELRGSWNGETLTLSGKCYLYVFDEKSATTTSTDPALAVTTTLKRDP